MTYHRLQERWTGQRMEGGGGGGARDGWMDGGKEGLKIREMDTTETSK